MFDNLTLTEQWALRKKLFSGYYKLVNAHALARMGGNHSPLTDDEYAANECASDIYSLVRELG